MQFWHQEKHPSMLVCLATWLLIVQSGIASADELWDHYIASPTRMVRCVLSGLTRIPKWPLNLDQLFLKKESSSLEIIALLFEDREVQPSDTKRGRKSGFETTELAACCMELGKRQREQWLERDFS